MVSRRNNVKRIRRGAIAVLTAILIIPLLGLVAFAIDLGYLAMARSELQATADSAALAGATLIETDGDASAKAASRQAAQRFAAENRAANVSVALNTASDVQFGFWNSNTRQLEPPRATNPKINAISVHLHRDAGNAAGPIQHFFAPVLGIESSDLAVKSVAFIPNPVPSKRYAGRGTRFLIDDEMVDKDERAIENLADELNVDPEVLIAAKNEKSTNPVDWFLNLNHLAAGQTLELPTGQVGDEGLLDIAANDGHPTRPQYPFTNPVVHTKFLKFNKTSESDPVSVMRRSYFADSQLDPLRGVGRFNQPALYPELVNPDFVHVSPVYKSDVSALDGVKDKDEDNGPDLNGDGNPDGHTTNDPTLKGVCAKDYRRGLLAFKIVGYRIDPSRPYPYLPNLIIELVDPHSINLDEITAVDSKLSKDVFSSGGVQNVRLAR